MTTLNLTVSMDGLRRNVVSSFNELVRGLCGEMRKLTPDTIEITLDKAYFNEMLDNLASNINVLNYIYIEDTDFKVLEGNDCIDAEEEYPNYLK